MPLKNELAPKTWVEISRSAILYNLKKLRGVVQKDVKIACVVKANAYGHGLNEVVGILGRSKNFYFFCVDNVEEALILREQKIYKPILVLGYTPVENLRVAIDNGISFTIYDLHHLRSILKIESNKKAKVHLKIETGMNRQGILPKDVSKFINIITKHADKIFLEGVSTHFATAGDNKNQTIFNIQMEKFSKAISIIKNAGIDTKLLLKHCAATAAIFRDFKSHFNMVRCGIGLYGLWDSEYLKPVLTWKSLVAQVKDIEKGEIVSYSATWRAKRKTSIAIVPIGYSDGYDRGFSNCGEVLIRGVSARILGRVCMNMIIVDVTKVDRIKEGDEVIIIGKDRTKVLSATDLANKIGTINYEIVSRINPVIKRVVIK
jgi:alanine racemase